MMGWRYKAGLGMIGAFVLIWVTAAEVTRTGLMDESTKLILLGVWIALFVVFAGRKLTQPIEDLTAKIKRDLKIELEAKVNKKVQENMAWILKNLRDANPDLNLDIREFCPALSSEDDFGTPFTEPGISSYILRV